MESEQGNLGIISRTRQQFVIDRWVLDLSTDVARVYCSFEKFVSCYNVRLFDVTKEEMRPNILGSTWLVRINNEDHIYYGQAQCRGISFPSIQKPDPILEYCMSDLVLYMHFVHQCFGPYHIKSARAMAKNGNDMFFDFLGEKEIDSIFKSKPQLAYSHGLFQ